MMTADQGDIAAIRREYQRAALELSDTDPDPLLQFLRWFGEAREAMAAEPSAMTLATIGADGQPDARVVLLKGADSSGFTFYTDRRSAKGRQIAANPRAALCFWWAELERQIRVRGRVTETTMEESAAYFASRPRESQVSAWTSEQSAVVADRGTLDRGWTAAEQRFAGAAIPLPPHWGGYCLIPEELEFWQGRAGRLHDRIHYRRAGSGAWIRERLSP